MRVGEGRLDCNLCVEVEQASRVDILELEILNARLGISVIRLYRLHGGSEGQKMVGILYFSTVLRVQAGCEFLVIVSLSY